MQQVPEEDSGKERDAAVENACMQAEEEVGACGGGTCA